MHRYIVCAILKIHYFRYTRYRKSIDPILYTLGTLEHCYQKEALSKFHGDNSHMKWYIQYEVNRNFENIYNKYTGARGSTEPIYSIFDTRKYYYYYQNKLVISIHENISKIHRYFHCTINYWFESAHIRYMWARKL